MSYVYRRSEEDLWTVGFYDPAGHWQPESDHPTASAAAFRVHWLNGGRPASQNDEASRGIRHALWVLAKEAISAEPSHDGMARVTTLILELLELTEKESS